jgi:hypothetical protein
VIATAQYDNARTGANLLETILVPQNVNAAQFGRIVSFLVDSDVYRPMIGLCCGEPAPGPRLPLCSLRALW